ncbi:site-specific integrase [Paraliomyxa miuraensis]|uniref:site-specific integrase n=1 Tax=Paraliomyxa miuraensis TaxID=376150 RepID=UPI00225BFD59|nr:site-specific integrase [Paraliomyxa miuraensis]MCX4240164.1 site-specific integrase [Paraliomyxa miuraensis]
MRKRLDTNAIAAAVRTAKDTGEEVELWDTTEAGLCCRVYPTGSAVWQYRYRVAGRQRRLKIGRWPALTVHQARGEAAALRRAVEKGEDPQAAKVAARGGLLLVDAFERFVDEPGKRGRPRKPRTVALYRQVFRDHIAPALGRTRVDAITSVDVERLKLATRKRIGKGRGHGQAAAAVVNRTLALLSAICGAAERWGELPRGSNPCVGVERVAEEARERYLRAEELAALESTIAAGERGEMVVPRPPSKGRTSGRKQAPPRPRSITPSTALALRLLVWTGSRASEITGLRWGMVDLEGACLRLPDSKSGAKVTPLVSAAVDLLRQALADLPAPPSPDALVCSTRNGQPLRNLSRDWGSVRAAAGLTDVRRHDLRHTFASVALNTGVSLAHVGAMLGHKNQQTTNRYAHIADDALRAAVERTGDAMAASMAAGANVVRLPTRAQGVGSKRSSKRAKARTK